MKFSQSEFDRLIRERGLRIALVGMSNSGKSTTSGKLKSQLGFEAFEVDEAINRALGIESMADAAAWMGYPFDDRYSDCKSKYLSLEEQFTRVVIPGDRSFVLDTTGSIIYGSADLLGWIQKEFLVVGIRVEESFLTQMIDDYFQSPKTVVWGEEFNQNSGETGIEALKRCYPTLLRNRAIAYEELSDVLVDAEMTRQTEWPAKEFLDVVRAKLPGD